MGKDKSKGPLDKLLLDNVSNKYELILSASKVLREKAKKDGKIKITPELIVQALHEVVSKEAEVKEISKGKGSKEEDVRKKKPEEK